MRVPGRCRIWSSATSPPTHPIGSGSRTITYIPTWAGFLYLAVVLDAFSRRVVGWSMANHLRTQLVLDALDMALWQRRPDGVIHHSDQGSQHLARLRQAMPGRRRAPLHRIGRGLLRQRHVRKLLRDPRMRTARAPEVPVSRRSADGRLRVHRGLVQSATAPLRHRISVTRQLRTEPATPRSPKSITVHETGSTPIHKSVVAVNPSLHDATPKYPSHAATFDSICPGCVLTAVSPTAAPADASHLSK